MSEERQPLLSRRRSSATPGFYAASGFGISLSQLVQLISDRGHGAANIDAKYGGVAVGGSGLCCAAHNQQGVAQRLNVDLDEGLLDESEIETVCWCAAHGSRDGRRSASASLAATACHQRRAQASGR